MIKRERSSEKYRTDFCAMNNNLLKIIESFFSFSTKTKQN